MGITGTFMRHNTKWFTITHEENTSIYKLTENDWDNYYAIIKIILANGWMNLITYFWFDIPSDFLVNLTIFYYVLCTYVLYLFMYYSNIFNDQLTV